MVSFVVARQRTNLVVDAEGLVGILDQLVDGESSVVRLDNGVGHLGRGHDGEGRHHAVGELLADLGDEEGAHTGAGATAKGVGDLEALEAVAAFGLATHNVQNLVDELGALSVVALGPVVASTGLTKDEVVRAEELAERTGADGIHGAGLEVDEHSARDILVVGGLWQVRMNRVWLAWRTSLK
jgi:hypothetical protein